MKEKMITAMSCDQKRTRRYSRPRSPVPVEKKIVDGVLARRDLIEKAFVKDGGRF